MRTKELCDHGMRLESDGVDNGLVKEMGDWWNDNQREIDIC